MAAQRSPPRGRAPAGYTWKDGHWLHVETGEEYSAARQHLKRLEKRKVYEQRPYWDPRTGVRARRLERSARAGGKPFEKQTVLRMEKKRPEKKDSGNQYDYGSGRELVPQERKEGACCSCHASKHGGPNQDCPHLVSYQRCSGCGYDQECGNEYYADDLEGCYDGKRKEQPKQILKKING